MTRMIVLWALISSLLTLQAAGAASPAKRSYDTHNYYVLRHNSRISSGASLDDVVHALGVEFVEQAGELKDHWLVRKEKTQEGLLSRDSADSVLSTFEALKTRAVSPIEARSGDSQLARRVVSSVDYLSLQRLRQRVKRAPPSIKPPSASSSRGVAARLGIMDPKFPDQWHLVNDEYPENMMNVTGVWDMGFKGKGVISSLVDDGLEYESEDLSANFDADDSYDFNDHEKLPTPKNSDDHHGTRCAGQIAAEKNNVCGIGIAYESKVAGVRILSGPISDVDEAAALNYGFQNVSIYSCSWGPPDNGQSMEGPNYLIQKAVVNGINNGRGGKGSIFVFASGNGAQYGDQCNFDGYTNSIYSVTVSAVDYKGLHPYYSESCAANMIVAYSSGSGRHIVTTDKGKNACASSHGGTSAAAPNAVGVFALALEARPDLTWRDVQHLCVQTARVINTEDPDWEKTAHGRLYSYKYGFGVLDGYAYVKAAQAWTLVKPQARMIPKTIQLNNGTFGQDEKYSGGQFIGSEGIESKLTITKDLLLQNNFESLEHINVKVWIDHTNRGDVEVEIVSPKGIRSVLGGNRKGDRDTGGYPGWTFMSVKHWGEDPVGDWTIKVKDQNEDERNGTFLGWNMIFWGSVVDTSKAEKYEVDLIDNLLPPAEAQPRPTLVTSSSASVKQHPKPTANLPADHGEATGENSIPAFTPGSPSPTGSPSTISSTPDVGWFSDMSSLVTGQKWFFVALGAVSIFGIGVGVFFWRRRAAIKAANYTALNNEGEMSMNPIGTSMSGGLRTTRELYDAFGELSDDDDDDDDENSALRKPLARSTGGLGFHSGFLDDDDPSTAAGLTPKYRDEPETQHEDQPRTAEPSTPHRGASPTGSVDHHLGS
ncbi:peptidase S8/S53 domain-containing protein [Crassisporium funariophilum]|nr:peptidase S8/S53 domain-containing protein [Crassisporium funariophilum]